MARLDQGEEPGRASRKAGNRRRLGMTHSDPDADATSPDCRQGSHGVLPASDKGRMATDVA